MTSFFRAGAALDPIYLSARDGIEEHHSKGRAHLNFLWIQGAAYIDSDARERATRDLPSVFWELQLAHVLKCAGKNLVPRYALAYNNNKGPDLFVEGEPQTWLEAVVPRPGTGPDAVTHPERGKAYGYDPDGVVLRLCSVIGEKSQKLRDYSADGIIRSGQATVIAICGVMPPWRYSGITPPEIVRAVYGVNNSVLQFDRSTRAFTGAYVEHRNRVKKSKGGEVLTDVFLNPEFSHVSAALFDDTDWVNSPSPPGSDLKLVHNPLAATPLPDGWLPVGSEYWWAEAQIKSRRHKAGPEC